MSAALLLAIVLLSPAAAQDASLANLYEQGRLDDIVSTAGERLARDPALHALAHITGGGFTDNIPRVLPPGVDAVVDRDAWTPPALFLELARRGPVERAEMDRTFNMGIGMVLLVDAAAAGRLVDELAVQGERPVVMGRVEPGRGVVRYAGRETLPT